jgi:hypothetical protein
MSNPFHLDFLLAHSGGDTTTPAQRVKSGAMALTITAPNLDGGTLILEYRPYTTDGVAQWYSKPAGTFTQVDLDANNQVWDNTLIGEGEVRFRLTGTLGASAVITEVYLRPTHETDIEL